MLVTPLQDTILSIRQVCEVVGLSRTTIWRLCRGGHFPAPISLSPGRVGWSKLAIQAWLDERMRQSPTATLEG